MKNGTVKTLVALDGPIDAASVEASLAAAEALQIIGIADGMGQSWALLEETSPDLLVVAMHGSSDRALRLIEGAARQRPERPIVVLYMGAPNGFVQRAFAAGVDDMACLPQSPEDVRFMIEKVLARRRGAGTLATVSPMVAILGPKGGTGKTLTSCNLAVALAQRGSRTVLVDLDLQFGDVGLALGLRPDRTIYDLVRAGGSLDAEKVEAYLVEHEASGLRVMLAPTRPDQASHVSVDFLSQVYGALRSVADVVVVDTPPSFSPEVIATVDAASHLCLVGMLDALSLKDSKLGLETLALMGHDAEKITFVLNRANAKVGITRDDARTVLGRDPDALVPEDPDIPRFLTHGKPIVVANDRAPAARAFADLATSYLEAFAGEVASPEREAGRRGLLRIGRNGGGA